MGWQYGYEPMMGFGFAGAIVSVVWMIVLIVLAVVAVRFILGRGSFREEHERRLRGRSSALDILEERYAKGEIDRAEFEEKKKDLS